MRKFLFVEMQLPLALLSFISWFSCPVRNFTVLVHSHCSHNVVLGCSKQLFSVKKLKKIVHYLLCTKQWTDTISHLLLDILEHLADKEQVISLRS